MTAPGSMSVLDRLKAAANLKPIRKVVTLSNGDEIEFWHRPLTIAQRERAQKSAKSDEATAFAMQLLIDAAMDEHGQKIFNAGHISELKHWCRDEDVQKMMLAVLSNEEEDADKGPPTVDMKSTTAGTVKG